MYQEPVYIDELQQALQNSFPDGKILVEDTAGDSQHYSIKISSSEFCGLSLLSQHQLVYKKLGPLVPRIHALQIKTVAITTK